MKVKNWFKKFFAGMGIGAGAAIPGVSGSTIAIIIGIFKDIISAINNIFKQFKRAILTLIPILIGIICAFVPCVLFFDIAFECCAFALVSLFTGFIIGSFTEITDQILFTKIKVKHIVILVIAFLVALGIGAISVFYGDAMDISGHFDNPEWWFYLIMIPVGAIGAMALLVPGISGSMTLMVLGFYRPFIAKISDIFKGQCSNVGQTFGLAGCFAIGALIGFYLLSKLIDYLLKNHHTSTYYAIIGFVIGSTIALFFNYEISKYYTEWFNGKPNNHWMPYYIEVPLGLIINLAVAFLFKKIISIKHKKETENQNQEIVKEKQPE